MTEKQGGAKPWWKSKTMWVQIATAAIAGIEMSGLAQVVPEGHQWAVVLGLAALNAVVRYLTDKPIRLGAEQ